MYVDLKFYGILLLTLVSFFFWLVIDKNSTLGTSTRENKDSIIVYVKEKCVGKIHQDKVGR